MVKKMVINVYIKDKSKEKDVTVFQPSAICQKSFKCKQEVNLMKILIKSIYKHIIIKNHYMCIMNKNIFNNFNYL